MSSRTFFTLIKRYDFLKSLFCEILGTLSPNQLPPLYFKEMEDLNNPEWYLELLKCSLTFIQNKFSIEIDKNLRILL